MLKNSKIKAVALIMGLASIMGFMANAQAVTLPNPISDEAVAASPGTETIVLAGGCFWGIQAVFQHVKGVTQATSGYAGGEAPSAHYDMVSTGTTGHAESVQVSYDPAQITMGQILKIFFSVAHNPTELNRQGPDHGTQYRSAIFVNSDAQRKIASDYIDQLNQVKVFDQPIVTEVDPLKAFYAAEGYHQDYAKLHPANPYIAINDAPKVSALESTFPQLYKKN